MGSANQGQVENAHIRARPKRAEQQSRLCCFHTQKKKKGFEIPKTKSAEKGNLGGGSDPQSNGSIRCLYPQCLQLLRPLKNHLVEYCMLMIQSGWQSTHLTFAGLSDRPMSAISPSY